MTGDPVAIVLAAGGSARLGPEKYFAPIGGQAIVERVIRAFLASAHVKDVVLVIPPARADDFSWLRSVKVHLTENPDPGRGPISSRRRARGSSATTSRASTA